MLVQIQKFFKIEFQVLFTCAIVKVPLHAEKNLQNRFKATFCINTQVNNRKYHESMTKQTWYILFTDVYLAFIVFLCDKYHKNPSDIDYWKGYHLCESSSIFVKMYFPKEDRLFVACWFSIILNNVYLCERFYRRIPVGKKWEFGMIIRTISTI